MRDFETETVGLHTHRIIERTGVCCYLIQGEEAAALIDTGAGIGNLAETVRKLTDLPVHVLLTHGHMDHAGGTGSFQDVSLHPADWDMLPDAVTAESRWAFIRSCKPHDGLAFQTEDMVQPFDGSVHPVSDGEIWDLGGIHLQAHHIPGHTKGSVAYLAIEDRILFMGDGAGIAVFLFQDQFSTTVRQYRETVQKLMALQPQYDLALRHHGSYVCKPGTLEEVLAACNAILAGKDARQPIVVMGDCPCYAAFPVDRVTKLRLDGVEGNVFYSDFTGRE